MPKPQGFCIFCGSSNLSKEHFWSEWMHPYFPKEPGVKLSSYHANIHGKTRVPLAPPTHMVRDGGALTKKLRVVCKKCNETWMSQVETKAKPILVPLLKGDATSLDKVQQTALSEWIAMKSFVAEHSQKDGAIYPAEVRKQFKANKTIPQPFQISVAQCNDPFWACAYRRDAAQVRRTRGLPVTGKSKNIQAISFGVGKLFIQVFSTTYPDAGVRFNPTSAMPVKVLWPIQDEVLCWPPSRPLTSAEAHGIALSLDQFFRKPNVLYEERAS